MLVCMCLYLYAYTYMYSSVCIHAHLSMSLTINACLTESEGIVTICNDGLDVAKVSGVMISNERVIVNDS